MKFEEFGDWKSSVVLDSYCFHYLDIHIIIQKNNEEVGDQNTSLEQVIFIKQENNDVPQTILIIEAFMNFKEDTGNSNNTGATVRDSINTV